MAIGDTARARNIRRVRHRIYGINEDLAEVRAAAAREAAVTGTASFAGHRRQLDLLNQLAEARRELATFETELAAAA